MTSKQVKSLALWDSECPADPKIGAYYSWNGYGESDLGKSLLRYVDAHGERLRARYCEFIFDLAERKLQGKSLAEHLVVDIEFSFWWTTLLVEKSLWKSPTIADAIRLLAFEEIIRVDKPEHLCLFSANKMLRNVLGRLCTEMDITFKWVVPSGRISRQRIWRPNIRRLVVGWLPHTVQAVLALGRYLVVRWPLRRTQKVAWHDNDRSLFFCSYFNNVDAHSANQGHFQSHYWGQLPCVISEMGGQANWLHLFVSTNGGDDSKRVNKWLSNFNRNSHTEGYHAFLDTYLSLALVLGVLIQWFRLVIRSLRLQDIDTLFRPRCSMLWLWPVLREEWHSSTRGVVAMNNHINIALFDRAMRDLPHQRQGFYLCENQAWERAFVHAWRKYGHGKIIAVPHSTRSFWDLRFFRDPLALSKQNKFSIPSPDLTVVNGIAARREFLHENYPIDTIKNCEALRYGYLNELPPVNCSSRDDGRFNILILGEYLPSVTARILGDLELALPFLDFSARFTIKPHPNCPITAADYPKLDIQITNLPLRDILHTSHVAYTGNSTSAAVDAYCAGVPVVSVLDPTTLNLSPLRGCEGVLFASTPKDLAHALISAAVTPRSLEGQQDFFTLDSKLPRWRKLLSECH